MTTQLVTHVQVPKWLFLAWQPPDSISVRHRWAVGRIYWDGDIYRLHYFNEEEIEEFNSRPMSELKSYGYWGYPGFDLRSSDYQLGVKEALLRRLPPASRDDFPAYKRWFLLDPDQAIPTFALLGRTEARLPGDGFSVVDPLLSEGDYSELMLEVAGFRHQNPSIQASVKVGSPVTVELEPTNKEDSRAVVLSCSGSRIGYINRLQTEPFHHWLAACDVRAEVARLNGPEDRPRAFIFVWVRPHDQVAA